MAFVIRTDIKNSLKICGKSIADLSRELEIPYQTMDSYLNGRRNIPKGIEARIAKTLEVWYCLTN